MADVRLVATNPIDSSLVPVACNTGGEFLLASPGDLTDVHVLGDLSVDGTSTFDDNVIIDGPNSSVAALLVRSNYAAGVGNPVLLVRGNTDNDIAWIDGTGEATFAGNVTIGKTTSGASDVGARFVKGAKAQLLSLDCVAGGSTDVVYQVNNNGSGTVQIKADGSVTFDGTVQTGVGFFSDRPAGDAAKNVLRGTLGGVITSSILADGSGEFSGEVVVASRGQKWTLVEQGGLCHMVAFTRNSADPVGVDLDDEEPEYLGLRDVFKELDMVESALQEVMERLRMAPPAGWEVWDGSDNV